MPSRARTVSVKADIQTLIEERDQLETVMSALADAILAIDAEGNPLFFNSRFAVLFEGRKKLSEAFAHEIGVQDAFQAVLREGRSAVTALHLYVPGLKNERYYSLSTAPLKRSSGEVYGAVGVFHDVTEMKLAEKIRMDFVANVSHELRTPLTSIKGYADTILEDVRARRWDGIEGFCGALLRNVQRLMNLITDLLDLSALESGMELHRTSVDVEDITERVWALLTSGNERRWPELRLTTQVERLDADPAKLEQVLTNLLANALKYAPHSRLISVSWMRAKRDRGVELHVKDDGPGIAPEHLSRLFERFYRVDKARSRELGGTGLGLAIVKHIVQAHGGQVNVTSELGHGTEFICSFPEREK